MGNPTCWLLILLIACRTKYYVIDTLTTLELCHHPFPPFTRVADAGEQESGLFFLKISLFETECACARARE